MNPAENVVHLLKEAEPASETSCGFKHRRRKSRHVRKLNKGMLVLLSKYIYFIYLLLM
jgi:hypothetical protein